MLFKKIYHVIGLFVICVAVIIIGVRAATPYLNRHYLVLQKKITQSLPVSMKPNRLTLEWQGSFLVLRVDGMRLYDEMDETEAAFAKEVQFFIHPLKSLLTGKLYFRGISIRGLRLTVLEEQAGKYGVKGFSTTQTSPIQQWLTDWPTDQIEFLDTDLHIIELNGDSLPFSDLQIRIIRKARQIELNALATLLLEETPSHLALHARLDDIFDLKNSVWHMSAYRVPAYLMNRFQSIGNLGDSIPLSGSLSFQSWIQLSNLSLQKATIQFAWEQFGMSEHVLQGGLDYQTESNHQWHLIGTELQLDQQEPFNFHIQKKSDKYPWTITLANLDITPWWQFLNQSEGMPAYLPQVFKNNTLNGKLVYAFSQWSPADRWEDWQYHANFQMEGLTFNQAANIPGFSNLDIVASLDEKGGFAQISAEKSLMTYAGVIKEPILLHHIQAPIEWFRLSDYWLLQSHPITAYRDQSPLIAFLSTQLLDGGEVDPHVSFLIKQFPLQDFQHALPTEIMAHGDTSNWFETAQFSGTIAQCHGLYRGKPVNFPFTASAGRFELAAKIENLYLDYDPNWPAIESGTLDILGQNVRFEGQLTEGIIAGSSIQQATAQIENFQSPVLTIQGDVDTKIETILSVLEKGKLLNQQDREAINLSGSTALSLNLRLPINHPDPITVTGDALLDQLHYKGSSFDINIDHITGKVHFDNNELHAQSLQANFLGKPLTARLVLSYPSTDYHLSVSGQGEMGIEELSTWLQYAPGPWISGTTNYHFIWLQDWDSQAHAQGTLSVNSQLNGIQLTGPIPFFKQASSDLPLDFKIAWNNTPILQLDFSVKNLASGTFHLAESSTQLSWVGGQLLIGESQQPKYPDSDKIELIMQLPTASCQSWYAFGNQMGISKVSTLPIIDFDLDVQQFACFSDFGHVQAIGTKTADGLKANLIGESLHGTWEMPGNTWPDLVQVKLDKLRILGLDSPQSNTLLSDWMPTQQYQIQIGTLNWQNKQINNIIMHGKPIDNAFYFTTLSADSYGTTLKATGRWQKLPRETQIQGTIKSQNVGPFLQAWQIPSSIKSGQAQIVFDINWPYDPWLLALTELSGNLDIQLKTGQITGVEPGIGRILSLFDLDTIKRRLQLDFSDLFKEGLAFDSLKTSTSLNRGVVTSNDLQLKAPSSTIEGNLILNWPKDEVSGTLYASPNLSGSIPVAAALAAGNPAVGAAFWAISKLVKQQEVVKVPTGRYVYRVSGSLSNPVLSEETKR